MIVTTQAPETSTANAYISMWIKEGILYGKYADNLHLSLEIAKAGVERRIFFSQGKSYALLVDMRGIKSTTKQASRYLATIGTTLVKAAALITGSAMNRALGNIFLTIDKPAVPTKLFTSEEKAREWLLKYL